MMSHIYIYIFYYSYYNIVIAVICISECIRRLIHLESQISLILDHRELQVPCLENLSIDFTLVIGAIKGERYQKLSKENQKKTS